jgi:hypothetical protein
MLVYEPGQFFVPHQDSEKDDMMIGTLVVTLPSAYTGGALVIDDGGAAVTYRGSKVALSLVAFYADCRHEVRPVTSGYRITLTYNLLMRGDASRPLTDEDGGAVGELARCLDQHFTTGRPRLVYLLDHEYTARGLSWSRLKGTDAHRAALLRAAADRSGCETVLALADVQETWSAYESEPEYGYRGRDRHWEAFEDDDHDGGGSGEYELDELIESSVRLLHWIAQAGTGVADISLTVDDAEVCATTPSTDLQPYTSQYEGYMGNYGNTMDRWYRRAALVVWPHDQAFRNRAEAAPGWALDELGARVRANDLAGARAAAAALEPIWNTAARAAQSAGFVGKALRTARALDDAKLAEMLLHPFRIESLSPTHMPPLARLAAQHGGHWVDGLLRTWFGDRESWAYAGGQDRSVWLASLPRLCQALHAKGAPGTDTAHRLLDLSWGWLGQSIRQASTTQQPSYRDERLSELGKPLAAVLTAAGQTGAVKLRDRVVEFTRQQKDEVIACMMPALRTVRALPADTRRDSGFDDLTADCVTRLRVRLAHPSRAADDWSIDLPDGCACDPCGTLGAFLRDRARRTFEWPLAKEGRRHVHSRIDTAELPVRHETRRAGRPYTLILTKSPDLFAREEQARKRDEADLELLITHSER